MEKVEIQIMIGGDDRKIYRCFVDRVDSTISRDEVPNLLATIASELREYQKNN
jgi:hypothetical protein